MERKKAVDLFDKTKKKHDFFNHNFWKVIKQFDRFDKRDIQSYKIGALKSVFKEIEMERGANAVIDCKKIVVLYCLLKNWDNCISDKYPLSIQNEYRRNFVRILDICQQSHGWGKRREDIFWKDLGIVREHVFPFGPGVVESYSGYGLQQGLSKNIKDSLSFLKITALLGGRKGYYQTHLHPPLMDDFNEEGWNEGYKRIGEMLILNKHIKGLVSCNWFRDPQLKTITPELSYLREIPINNGAKIFYAGKDNSKNALINSFQRTKLYKEKIYTPQLFFMIWPRKKLIEFAQK